MVPSDDQSIDDGLLRRYLLGELPEADTERLHELSVADDAFAGRLDAIENDLVDAYVRGELSQENLKQFKSFYLSSPKRRQKVEIAEGFLALEHRAAVAPSEARAETAVPFSRPRARQGVGGKSSQGMLAGRRLAFQWGLAAACLVLLIAGAYVLFQNVELRRQITQAQNQRGAADQHAGELERQLEQARAAKEEALSELQRSRESHTNLDQLKIVSALLPPPMRGAGSMPAISLQSGADLVVLVLPLEADDFPAYQAKLKDPVTNRVLWSSARLTAATSGEKKEVSISFRAGLLKQQNYLVDLAGIPKHGAAEPISTYAFRVVLQ